MRYSILTTVLLDTTAQHKLATSMMCLVSISATQWPAAQRKVGRKMGNGMVISSLVMQVALTRPSRRFRRDLGLSLTGEYGSRTQGWNTMSKLERAFWLSAPNYEHAPTYC